MSDDRNSESGNDRGRQSPRPLADFVLRSGSLSAALDATSARPGGFLPASIYIDIADPDQRRFGEHDLIEKIGEGGMAVVYRARERALDREVALKLLAAGPLEDDAFIERFKREARAVARMQHPHIVAIYQVGRHDSLHFFSMQLVRGESLAETIVRNGALAPRAVADLVRTIAEALDYAHQMGVLHLDLKPANVLIDTAGRPLIADFGLAQLFDELASGTDSPIAGTPAYIAPELLASPPQLPARATDIYGLGVILYEALTGQPPFSGSSRAEILRRVRSETISSLRPIVSSIPADLEAICMRCLAKDPSARYASARDVADDLGAFLAGRAVSTRRGPPLERLARAARREPRITAAIMAVMLAVVAGLTATSLEWRRAERNAVAALEGSTESRLRQAQFALAAGDGFQALRPLLANLSAFESNGDHAGVARERLRIGTILANAPRLVGVIDVEPGLAIHAVALNASKRRFAVTLHGGAGSRAVRSYDLDRRTVLWTTPTDVWEASLPWRGSMHGWLRYSPDGTRMIATMPDQAPLPAPRVADSMPLDADRGTLLRPAPGPDIYDLVANDQSTIGLLRRRADPSHRFPDTGQLVEIDSWRPLGAEIPLTGDLDGASFLPSPDGRFWAASRGDSEFVVYGARGWQRLWSQRLPVGELVRSWRFDPASHRLAIGTTRGRVRVFDPATGAEAPFDTVLAAPVRWLAFDPSGERLSARATDGGIGVWDVASGRSLVPMIVHDAMELGRLQPDGEGLWTVGPSGLRFFGLPPSGVVHGNASPGITGIWLPGGIAAAAFAVDSAARTLVVGGQVGRIALFRLPRPPLQPGETAPLPVQTLRVSAGKWPAVDGSRVEIRSLTSGESTGPVFDFAEPVRLAELVQEDRRLVVVSGRTVHVLDAATGEPVGTPYALPESPLRAAIAATGSVIAIAHGSNGPDGFGERIHAVSLVTGAVMTDLSRIPGPITSFDIDAAGRRLLVGAWNLGSGTRTLSMISLAETPGCPAFDLGSSRAIGASVLDASGDRAFVHVEKSQRRSALLTLDLNTCSVAASRPMQGSDQPARILIVGNELILHRYAHGRLIVVAEGEKQREIALPDRIELTAPIATDRSGARVAIADRSGVRLVDTRSGTLIAGRLSAPLSTNDAIGQVAITEDGRHIVARSYYRRLVAWPLATADSDLELLEAEAHMLDPRQGDPPLSGAVLTRLQAEWDRSALATPAPRTQPIRIAVAAAPDAQPDARFVPLDLGSAANVAPRVAWGRLTGMGGELAMMPRGPQRLAGVDWEVDGAIQLSGGAAAEAFFPSHPISAPINAHGLRPTRVHVLMLVPVPMTPRSAGAVALRVIGISADRSETVLEARMIEHVASRQMPMLASPTARIGWIGGNEIDVRTGSAVASETSSFVYAVALDVPPTAPPLESLRFETRKGPMEAPVVYAVTLEVAPRLALGAGRQRSSGQFLRAHPVPRRARPGRHGVTVDTLGSGNSTPEERPADYRQATAGHHPSIREESYPGSLKRSTEFDP